MNRWDAAPWIGFLSLLVVRFVVGFVVGAGVGEEEIVRQSEALARAEAELAGATARVGAFEEFVDARPIVAVGEMPAPLQEAFDSFGASSATWEASPDGGEWQLRARGRFADVVELLGALDREPGPYRTERIEMGRVGWRVALEVDLIPVEEGR